MNTIKIDLSQDISQLEIHPFADEHIGDEHCDIKRLLERIDYVKNTPNAYCILNGDIIDNATKTSIGDVYMQEFNPMGQLEKAVEIFSPIKDKILCITHGNHENRTYKKEGINLSRLIARQLGLEEKYTPTSAVLFPSVEYGFQERSVSRRLHLPLRSLPARIRPPDPRQAARAFRQSPPERCLRRGFRQCGRRRERLPAIHLQ